MPVAIHIAVVALAAVVAITCLMTLSDETQEVKDRIQP